MKTAFFLFLNLLVCKSSLFWCVGGKPEVVTPHSSLVWWVRSRHSPLKENKKDFLFSPLWADILRSPTPVGSRVGALSSGIRPTPPTQSDPPWDHTLTPELTFCTNS